jgi:predicted dinucleotide-binding enzyme
MVLLEFNDLDETFAAWFSETLRTAANRLRDEMGVPRIGEGWISETALFAEIQDAFSELVVVQHGRPKWLGRQHFDIWIPEANVAIEYHGAQHFRPVAFFGGEAAFRATQARDKKKLALAKRHGVQLLVVTEDMSGAEVAELVHASVLRGIRKGGVERSSTSS